MPKLTVAISAHGYGHAAQTAPVVEALASLVPDLKVMLHSDLPAAVLRQFFPMARGVTSPLIDLGMRMRSAFEVDRPRTAHLYTAMHVDFARSVESEAERLRRTEPDLVLANISYLALAAAARLGVPSVGLCSLTWLPMLAHYCGDMPDAARIQAEMLAAYRAASLLIAPTPAMPMPQLETLSVGPVARLAADDARAQLVRAMRLGPGERAVLVSLGGIAQSLPFAQWPAIPGVRFLLSAPQAPGRADMQPVASLKLDHLDCLAGCDALVTKVGYGSLVEATCHGIPIVFARRGDWPDEESLIGWTVEQGRTAEIPRPELEQGTLAAALQQLWSEPAKEPVNPTGNLEAAEAIMALLR